MAEIGKFKLADALPKEQRSEADGGKGGRRAPTHETTADLMKKPGQSKRSGVTRRRIGDA